MTLTKQNDTTAIVGAANQQPITVISGLIVGKGYTKIVYKNRQCVFPSVAAPVHDLGYQSTLKERPDIIDLNGKGEWFVGEDALEYARNRAENLRELSRYTTPGFIALVRHALYQVLPEKVDSLRISTGIPALWFHNKGAKKELEAAIYEAAEPWKLKQSPHVDIAPESAGLFYDWAFEGGKLRAEAAQEPKKNIGIIDIGFRDVNLSWFRGRQYANGTSIRGGVVEALEFVKQSVMRQYGLEFSDHQVDAMVRAGTIRIHGQDYPLPEGTMDLIEQSASFVLTGAKNFFPNEGAEFDTIILGGGSSVYMVNALRSWFPQIVVPYATFDDEMQAKEVVAAVRSANPQFSGPRGFEMVARAIAGTL